MRALCEERFRDLIDERGILRPLTLAPPERSAGYTVFVQRTDAALDVAALKAHAMRFFGAKLGLTVDKRYRDERPAIDAARVVLASDDGSASGTRLCFGRSANESDHDAADAAERAQKTHGMALLARRCNTVWIIVRESDDDRVALTIAAIFASSMLGPILSPEGSASLVGGSAGCADAGASYELFGVRTARMKLEARARPYR